MSYVGTPRICERCMNSHVDGGKAREITCLDGNSIYFKQDVSMLRMASCLVPKQKGKKYATRR